MIYTDYNDSFCPYTGERCEYLCYGEVDCDECKFKITKDDDSE